MKKVICLLFGTALLFTHEAHASCKSGEIGGPSSPSDLKNRLYSFDPATHADISKYAVDQITVTTYNIQSGFSASCDNGVANVEDQAQELKNCHYFAMQEVDIDSIHCGCNQPKIAADITGKQSRYFRTIYNQGGTYGHASGSLYDILDTRWKIYTHYSTELRGLLATRTQPPQLKGRDLWFVSTHFQYDSVLIRTQTAQELIDYCKALRAEFPKSVILVAGDFYSQFGSDDYTTLASYLKDSYYEFTGDRTGGSTYPSTGPLLRDDYVWYNAPEDFPVVVSGYQVIDVQDSDHAPVRVNFAFTSLYPNKGTSLPTQTPYFPGAIAAGSGNTNTGSNTVAAAGSGSASSGSGSAAADTASSGSASADASSGAASADASSGAASADASSGAASADASSGAASADASSGAASADSSSSGSSNTGAPAQVPGENPGQNPTSAPSATTTTNNNNDAASSANSVQVFGFSFAVCTVVAIFA